MREVFMEARNVEEAIDQGCKSLGVQRDEIEFEIINLPKRGFLGLRNTPAKVRVYVEEPEKAAPPAPRAAEQKPARPTMEKNVKPVEPVREPRPAPKPETRQERAPEPKPQPRAVEEPKKPVEERPSRANLTFVSAETVDGKARSAADYVKAVLLEMGVAAEIAVAFTENGIILRLSGDGLGVIIGRRGETLDSLQYLAGLVSNRQEGDYMRVTIDSGNYREKRERTLEQLAQKLSNSVLRYGRASTLEPMNPYERRIIHATVSRIEGVTSSSIGEEPNRRVVISPTNPRPQQSRGPRPTGPRGPGAPGAPSAPGGPSRGGSGGRPPRRDGAPRTDGRPGEPRPFTPRPTDSRPGEGQTGERREFRTGDRGPRRDTRGPRRDEVRGEGVKPTPTSIDREYMKEIEREAPAFVKPEKAEQPAVRENPAPRSQNLKEGDDLPLYGKIEL